MKKLSLAFLLLASLQLIHADDVVKNSDFTDGANYWHGDGRTPADMKPQDSLDTAPNYGDVGLIVPLKAHAWTKIVQEFKTRSSAATLNITYMIAPKTTFSQKDEDYQNVPHSIEFDAWGPFDGKRNNFVAIVTDVINYRLFNDNVAPKLNSTGKQTYSAMVDSMVPDDEKTLCLTFPPGTGAVILLHVSLDTQ